MAFADRKMTAPVTLPPLDTLSEALVIDDHPLFCEALVLTLRSICPACRVRTAASLAEALSVIEDGATVPDVMLLDLNLPDVNGLDGLMRLRSASGGKCPVVVVSSMADNAMIAKALSAGAAGFVPKHSQKHDFHEALDAILKGGSYTPQGFVPDAEGSAQEDAVALLATLTNQQMRILQLICEGKLNKQIAWDLSIAETTVKAHVTAIMRKLGVQSRTQAVLVAQDARFSESLQAPPEQA